MQELYCHISSLFLNLFLCSSWNTLQIHQAALESTKELDLLLMRTCNVPELVGKFWVGQACLLLQRGNKATPLGWHLGNGPLFEGIFCFKSCPVYVMPEDKEPGRNWEERGLEGTGNGCSWGCTIHNCKRVTWSQLIEFCKIYWASIVILIILGQNPFSVQVQYALPDAAANCS